MNRRMVFQSTPRPSPDYQVTCRSDVDCVDGEKGRLHEEEQASSVGTFDLLRFFSMPREKEEDTPEMPAESTKIPQGGFSRGMKLGTALLGALGRATGRRLVGAKDDVESEAAADLAATLGEMKGLSMKLGQMLSYGDTQVPEGWRRALGRLQHQSPPMPRDTVFRIVEEDLGRPPDVLFAAWDEKPLAAASIGQVHRARLRNGTEVAVKVRYPAIDRIVQQDLDNVKLLRRFGKMLMPELDTEGVIAELRERFLEECDYRKEAESQTTFRQVFDGEEGIVIPRVYEDHSTERVLTTDLIDGQRFGDFARTAILPSFLGIESESLSTQNAS